jgi:hypothetical protein
VRFCAASLTLRPTSDLGSAKVTPSFGIDGRGGVMKAAARYSHRPVVPPSSVSMMVRRGYQQTLLAESQNKGAE